MPQISKCRIVNFWYNDGSRLIADELYDFGNMDSTKANSVLIDMENGIGKTVLLQLMLQPVVPKAKVSGRRIEDFFTKGTYHSYILLEWFKDNSSEKLLTGIAMAASDSMSQDDDSKGRGIKYYTFYTNYSGYDKYSIENLELSHKEKGRYVPASFDEVRNLARKSKGRITYFSSDESVGWKNLLLEYGIVQAEWNNVMVALNQKEGGISSYFEQYKKSDKIVDELLIPTVEGRFSEDQSRDEDNSLETMLITYARRYSQQKEFLEERAVSERLSGQLQEFRNLVEKLWDIKDQFDTAKGSYFAFYAQLEVVQKELDAKVQELEAQKSQKDQQILHIQTEQASADYYQADENYQNIQAEMAQLETQLEETQTALREARELVKIMECARIWGEIRQKDAQREAIQKSLDLQQEKSAQNEELKSLRYSVRAQLETLLPEKTKEVRNLQEELRRTEEKQKSLQAEEKKKKKESQSAISDSGMRKGLFEAAQQQTDSLVDKLQLPVSRLFFAGYQKQKLEEYKAKKVGERQTAVGLREEAATRLCALNEERKLLPEQKADLQIERRLTENKKEQKEQELQVYLARETEIFAICDRHNMEHSGCFSGVLLDYLKNRKIQAESHVSELNRELETVRRQIAAAERGSLHIISEIEEYLESCGVEYQPCEKYLLSLVGNGHLTEGKCLEILQRIPALAYGIVAADPEKILKDNHNGWLPAILPLFSYQDIQNILNGEETKRRDLALYSEEYFESHENFLERLKKQETSLEQEMESARERDRQIGNDVRIAEAFDFPEDWKDTKKAEIAALEEAIQSYDLQIREIENHMKNLDASVEQTQERLESYKEDIRSADGWLRLYDELMAQIQAEAEAEEKFEEADRKAKELQKALQQLEDSLQQISQSIEQLKVQKSQADDQLQKMQEVSEAVHNAEVAETRVGDWEALYEQYLTLTGLLGEEEQKLLNQLKGVQEKIDKERQLLRSESKDLRPDQYQEEEYSASRKQKAQEESERQEAEQNRLNGVITDSAKKQGQAESERNSARKTLLQLGQELLPRNEVGTDFANRILIARKEKSILEESIQRENERKKIVEREYGRVDDRLKQETKPERVPEIAVRINEVKEQNGELYGAFSDRKRLLGKEDTDMQKKLRNLVEEYKDSYSHIQEFFRNLKQMAENDGTGDHYFSMGELLDGVLSSLNLRIHQITGDLEDFDKSKEDLIRQCLLQARKILNGLNGIQNHSRIQVYEGRQNVQMIRMPGLPKEVDEAIARQSIENEIDKGTVELASRMQEDGITENDLRKKASQIVGSRQLVRKYIQKDHIRLEAYKVDKNPENAQHRSWEETQTENSGAQKFLVYFSIMVAIIAYNRSETGAVNTKEQTSVLILDNPFGPITSAYALKPMFALAHKLNVQMICLSNITLCDITVCFEKVIKAVLLRQPLSPIEMLTHEQDDKSERLEHGFYESEQLTLDDFWKLS